MIPSTLDTPIGSTTGRYTYLDREHDVAVVGYGSTLEEAFEGAAEGAFALMGDLEQVRAERTVPVSFIEEHDRRALTRWLELLIGAARQHHLVFSEFHLQRERGRWWGCATGGRQRGAAAREVQVKRTGTAVAHTARGWEASCVVQCSPRASAAPDPVSRPAVASDKQV